MSTNPITDAIEQAGSGANLARMLGVSPTAVYKWRDQAALGRPCVSAERAMQIEAVVGISRHRLRPDIWPQAKAA